ncbi:hypothetical protein DFP73DRAFT_229590 [Morchella snyderi]|nr:hypothetical protein DFP73DRAFT_229590 [Morchella snyderi]
MFQDWNLLVLPLPRLFCMSLSVRPGPRPVRFVGKRKHARLMSGHFIIIAGRWLQAHSSPVQPVMMLFLSNSSRNQQGQGQRFCTTPPS